MQIEKKIMLTTVRSKPSHSRQFEYHRLKRYRTLNGSNNMM